VQGEFKTSAIDAWVGNRVRTLRAARGISQTRLGKTIGVSFQQVQKYERGVNRISVSALVRIAQTLDVSIGAVLDGIEVELAEGRAPPDDETLRLARDIQLIRSHEVKAKLGALVRELRKGD
jgi:transcriptional regulator with XRE-family HTH domain